MSFFRHNCHCFKLPLRLSVQVFHSALNLCDSIKCDLAENAQRGSQIKKASNCFEEAVAWLFAAFYLKCLNSFLAPSYIIAGRRAWVKKQEPNKKIDNVSDKKTHADPMQTMAKTRTLNLLLSFFIREKRAAKRNDTGKHQLKHRYTCKQSKHQTIAFKWMR